LEKEALKNVKDLLLPDEEVLYVYDKWIRPHIYEAYRLVITNKRMCSLSPPIETVNPVSILMEDGIYALCHSR